MDEIIIMIQKAHLIVLQSELPKEDKKDLNDLFCEAVEKLEKL